MKTSIINNFLTGYVQNRPELYRDILAEDISIEYSTIGTHSGREDVLRALNTQGDYACRYNVTSNRIAYEKDGDSIVILNAFHFFVRVIKNEYLPLILGGKYKFTLRENQIRSVVFVLEAEAGNTYLAKTKWGYRLFEETKDIFSVRLDSVAPSYASDADAIRDTVYRLMLITDNGQSDFLSDVAEKDALCFLPSSTYPDQYGPEVSGKGMPVQDFVFQNKQMESQNHHSMRITRVDAAADSAVVTAEMFEPTRLGFKHFDALSVYKPYYNERWEFRLAKKDGRWKVCTMKADTISRFQTITYDTLEI